MQINFRSHQRWTNWEVQTLKILSQYNVPQRVIGQILGRSRKAVERKKYYLNKNIGVI